MAAAHGLAPKERVPLVFAARGIPRALFARESGAREAAVKAAVRRALDKLGAHSLRDVVETLLRQLDADRRR